MLEDLSNLPGWMAAAAAAYAIFLIAIAVHDLLRRRVPNVAIYPAIALAVGFAFLRPDGSWWSFLLAGAAGATMFVTLGLVSRGGMGMGDAKLATFVGLMAGWPGVVVAFFVAFAAGAVTGLVLIATGRLGRRDPLPFAPALAVGALTAAVSGQRLAGLLWPGIG